MYICSISITRCHALWIHTCPGGSCPSNICLVRMGSTWAGNSDPGDRMGRPASQAASRTHTRTDTNAIHTAPSAHVYARYIRYRSLTEDLEYKIFCFAEDDWKIQADSSLPHSSNYVAPANPVKTVLSTVTSLKTKVGTLTTLDMTPPAMTINTPVTTENTITVPFALNEIGTLWCRSVRKGFDAPTILQILDTNFKTEYPAASEVVITAYNSEGEPLHRAVDYDVYCYAEDDLCTGCKVNTGTIVSAVLATKTPVRMLDTTPPQMRLVAKEALSKDQIQITLQVDEGAKVWCAAWTEEPTVGVGGPAIQESNFEALIKSQTTACKDNKERQCGSFWVYDLDDLEDTADDSMTTQASYTHLGFPTSYHHIYIHTYIYICTYNVYAYTFQCLFVMAPCVFMYIYIYMDTYIYIHIFIYTVILYIYIYIHD